MPSPQVNGDVTHTSVFIDHLVSYPVINDSVEVFKSNKYGQKSIELSNTVYQTVANNAGPYLARPFEIVKPYVKAADDFGDKILNKLDEKFPAVKTPTEDIIGGARAFVTLPFRLGNAGKERVLNTYNSEYKKQGNNNHPATVTKAAVTTTLIISTDALTTLTNYLGPKKEEAKQAINERVNN